MSHFKIVNLDEYVIDNIKLDDVIAFKIAYAGAMGESGSIYFLVREHDNSVRYYKINYVHDDPKTVNAVYQGFFSPFYEEFYNNDFMSIPALKDWGKYDLGMGNFLFIQSEYKSMFESVARFKDEHLLDYPASLYSSVDDILGICFNFKEWVSASYLNSLL